MIAATPGKIAESIGGNDPSKRHPDLDWSAGAYVCHITDNFRIWAERFAAAALHGSTLVAPYDGDLLARARAYEAIPIEGALWSLQRAVEDWTVGFDMAEQQRIVLDHPDRGPQSMLDIARTNAHDAYHHQWDIRRSLEAGQPPTRGSATGV